jgi:hypothetical protein
MTRLQALRKVLSKPLVRQVVSVPVTSYWAQMSLSCAVHLGPAGDLYETFSLGGNVNLKKEVMRGCRVGWFVSVPYTVAGGPRCRANHARCIINLGP